MCNWYSNAITTSQKRNGFKEICTIYEAPPPFSVVSLVAKHQNRNLKDVTVILIVNNMQQIMDETNYRHTIARLGMQNFSNFMLYEHLFGLSQRWVYLPVPSLKPPKYRHVNSVTPGDEYSCERLWGTWKDSRNFE